MYYLEILTLTDISIVYHLFVEISDNKTHSPHPSYCIHMEYRTLNT